MDEWNVINVKVIIIVIIIVIVIIIIVFIIIDIITIIIDEQCYGKIIFIYKLKLILLMNICAEIMHKYTEPNSNDYIYI